MVRATSARSRSGSFRRSEPPPVRLTSKQNAFVRSTSPLALYRGGIASGKTVAGSIRTIIRRYEYPGTVQLIGGPSWDQVRDGTMRTLRRHLNPACIVYENQNDHRWLLDNGSELIFRTLVDPDVLRSLEFHDAYLDEIALCSQEALNVALGRLRLPYDADPTFRHALWGTTTPRGMDWTLDVFGWDGKPGYDVVHSTIFENRDNLPAGYIEQLEERYRGTPFYEQELLGLYTAFEGLVYPMFRRETHVRGLPAELSTCKAIAVGVDFGGITPTALELVGERASGRLYVYDEMYRVGATLPEIGAKLREWEQLAGRKLDVVACDGSEPVAIATLAAMGFNAVPADKDRDTGIKLVQQRLTGYGGEPGLTFAPECVGVLTEFGQYLWASRRDATTKIVRLTDTPIDHHGDALDALRYAVMALGQHTPQAVITLPSGRKVVGPVRSTAPAPARRSPLERKIPGLRRRAA